MTYNLGHKALTNGPLWEDQHVQSSGNKPTCHFLYEQNHHAQLETGGCKPPHTGLHNKSYPDMPLAKVSKSSIGTGQQEQDCSSPSMGLSGLLRGLSQSMKNISTESCSRNLWRNCTAYRQQRTRGRKKRTEEKRGEEREGLYINCKWQ